MRVFILLVAAGLLLRVHPVLSAVPMWIMLTGIGIKR